MEDQLWRFMDCSKTLSREQLELVIQKKKLNEVFDWFNEHFVKSSRQEYLIRCPVVIVQGPTGCGKSSTLKWIANTLKLQMKEYSETTDTTAIHHDILNCETDEDRSSIQAASRRRANMFEHFVINSLRYNTLYPPEEQSADTADSEFESDDEFFPCSIAKPVPYVGGVIIHIETPLTFARSQRIVIQCIYKLVKVIRDASKYLTRRIAIVFETLEGDCEIISLPTKMKQSLGIQVLKFNPVTKANMKKLIENIIGNLKLIIIDKETMDRLISDSDGDIRACLNTLQLICNRPAIYHHSDKFDQDLYLTRDDTMGLFPLPVQKKQKLQHYKVRSVRLNPSLMRDNARSLGLFHVLGKILYQKRLYPTNGLIENQARKFRSIDRPFPPENSTDYLVGMLDVEPKNLISWLHQHYYKFCGGNNIEKAALLLDNLAQVDTITLSSTQSTQFYEAHRSIDDLQVHLAIDATVFSLYEDQSRITKPSHKKIQSEQGIKLVKSSVESFSSSNGELSGFNRPLSMSLPKLVEAYQALLDQCTAKFLGAGSASIDQNKVLIDYAPYLCHMFTSWQSRSPATRANHQREYNLPFLDDENLMKIFDLLGGIKTETELDFDVRQEMIRETIDEIDLKDTEYRSPSFR